MTKTRNIVIVETTAAAPIRSALAQGCPGLEPVSLAPGELTAYLRRSGAFTGKTHALPDLVLADLSDPSALTVLAEIKLDPAVKRIPVLAFTAPGARLDLTRCYELGLNSVIEAPASPDAFADLLKSVCIYWFEHVELATH